MRRFWILALLAGCASSGDSADDHYRRAEESYSAGDFERTRDECERALLLNPGHGAARALRREAQFVLAAGSLRSMITGCGPLKHTQVLVEMAEAIQRGRKAYPDSRDRAAREFRMVMEYAKWMPNSQDLGRLTFQARRCLLYVESRGPAPIPDPICDCVFDGMRPSCSATLRLRYEGYDLPAQQSLNELGSLLSSFGITAVAEDGMDSVDFDRTILLPGVRTLREALNRVACALGISWSLTEEHVILFRAPS